MNLLELRRKLLAAARSNPPGAEVPYAFETRIMSRLAALPQIDEWAWWARALWRGAAACLAVALLVSVWSFHSMSGQSATGRDLDLEEAVLDSVNEADP